MSLVVYTTPDPTETEQEVLALIERLKQDLRHRVDAQPRLWSGGLRRMSEARAVQASNTIEGYGATLSDVVAAVDGEEPMETNAQTRLALFGYREAMTYVLQIAQEEQPIRIDEGLLKSLHYMMLKHELEKNPGRWRPGAAYVRREDTGEIVYEGPDQGSVPALIAGMLDELNAPAPDLFRAAMAHLNLVMIHPFKDGNGRMARCLQTLVLTGERIVAPVFSSIEEYLGANTPAYYAVLAEVGQGAWNPTNDARPWVRFCLTAHYRQAQTLLLRLTDFERMWVTASELASRRHLPERAVGVLSEAAYGLRVKRATYKANVEVTWGEPIADLTASRDLKAIVNAGLFTPIGDTRGRYYIATPELSNAWKAIRSQRPSDPLADPFKLVEKERAERQIALPLETG